MSAVPHHDSYDLVVQIRNETNKQVHWYWQGQPMSNRDSIHRRIKRMRRVFGDRMLGWRIVLVSLNQVTGEPVLSVVERGS